MKCSGYIQVLAFLSVFTIHTSTHAQVAPDAVIEWNKTVLDFAEEEDGFLTLKGLRTVTMLHLAMHDAINSTQPVFKRYLSTTHSANAKAIVAINQAAYTISVAQYPDREVQLLQLRDKWIAEHKQDDAFSPSMALGEEIARQVLLARKIDGWDGEAEYSWHPMGPGVYAEFNEHSGTPEGFIFGSGWAKAVPFGLDAHDAFTSPPPPPIESEAYSIAFDEVKALGSLNSETRSEDQSHLAMWWKDFVENSHNRLARRLVKEESLDLHQTIRLFALMNMSVYDAYVSSFHNKFLYNHWRPYTAIRWASNDGNPATVEDARWTNMHQHTYAFPSYPSAHGTACAAATTVLAHVFGDAYPYTMYTEEVDRAGPFSGKIKMDPPRRSFNSFHEAALECALSRVFLGIHFSYDSLEGVRLGKAVGGHIVSQYLKPH